MVTSRDRRPEGGKRAARAKHRHERRQTGTWSGQWKVAPHKVTSAMGMEMAAARHKRLGTRLETTEM